MLLDPRAPFIFGALMILLLAGYLALYHPMPGELASSHAQIAGMSHLSGCKSCHDEAGMAAGCLKCHQEIDQQLSRGEGYHHFLLKGQEIQCTSCHTEHFGRDFQLVNQLSWSEGRSGEGDPGSFEHPHVAFCLKGKHEELACEACHDQKLESAFALPGYPTMQRPKTFLGLKQDCVACHEDVHAGGLSSDCESCHGQETFRPATKFDHALHFALDGGHERTPCAGCHILPEVKTQGPEVSASTAGASAVGTSATQPILPFERVRGVTCAECHESPHRTSFAKGCETCHPGSEALWGAGRAGMTAELHGLSGFHLAEPHEEVPCEKCHDPHALYNERFPDPQGPHYARHEDTCEGCHEDVHGGQFEPRGKACLDCHSAKHFFPALYGLAKHEATYPLRGSHRAVPCTSCHVVDAETHVRRFVDTKAECKACHEDPHGGQFARELSGGDCSTCHGAAIATFAIRPFDHEGQTGYRLEGNHRKAKCVHCHQLRSLPGAGRISGSSEDSGISGKLPERLVRQYRGTPRDCSSCHKDFHRGQFQKNRRTACDSCHTSATTWKKVTFDHDTQSRFPLDGEHKNVPCASCHVPTRLPDGSEITQYKPLGTKCENCHEIVPR